MSKTEGADMTQNEMVLDYLKHWPTISARQASIILGVWRLSARICDLRCKGHNIETEMVTNGRVRYARYWLVK